MQGVILARVEADYKAQAKYGDELEVRVRLDGFGRSSFRYAYEIVDMSTGQMVLTARTVQVHYDYDKQTSVELSDETRRLLSTPVEATWQS